MLSLFYLASKPECACCTVVWLPYTHRLPSQPAPFPTHCVSHPHLPSTKTLPLAAPQTPVKPHPSIHPSIHHYSADALASASCRCGGNRYRSWLVYVVRSSTICRSCSAIIRRVPSLPLNCPLPSWPRCRTQQMMVHISRFGTLIDTGCDSPENLDAYARITLASPAASSGRISRLRIFCRVVSKQSNQVCLVREETRGKKSLTSRHCAHWPASTRPLMLLISRSTRHATLFWFWILR